MIVLMLLLLLMIEDVLPAECRSHKAGKRNHDSRPEKPIQINSNVLQSVKSIGRKIKKGISRQPFETIDLKVDMRHTQKLGEDPQPGINRKSINTEVNAYQWRMKRFAYEDTHEWPKDDSLPYDFDENGETEEMTLWREVGRNWQIVILRGIFIFSGVMMLLMTICCCCSVWCRVCCQSLRDNCIPCGGFLAIITSYYEDPMYKKAKDLAHLMGLKLDYETFIKIKERFPVQGSGQYNPLGLPHMQ